MSVIQTVHSYTLYSAEDNLVLRPLTDAHLPLLYKWNGDPEVVYWSDVGNDTSFDAETVRTIYGHVSKNALHFLIEYNGRPVGDCWLQKMNLPDVVKSYPIGTDIRRIDVEIGERDCWGKGIGTAMLALLVRFAFEEQQVDVLYNVCADYNIRSQKMQERLGFRRVLVEPNEAGNRAQFEYHYRLTRDEYFQQKARH